MSTAKKNIGSLNRRITIQASTLVPDGQGGNTETWADAIYLWSEILPGSSSRSFENRKSEIENNIQFRIRTGTLISKTNRILYGTKVCLINGIRADDYFNEFQIISARFDENSTGATTGGGTPDFPGASGLYSKYLTIVAGPTITDVSLAGFNILNIYRNGFALQLGTQYSRAGNTITFVPDLDVDEWVYVIYG